MQVYSFSSYIKKVKTKLVAFILTIYLMEHNVSKIQCVIKKTLFNEIVSILFFLIQSLNCCVFHMRISVQTSHI